MIEAAALNGKTPRMTQPMNDALHLHRILHRLATLCQTDLGHARAAHLQPASHAAEAELRLDRIAACDLLLQAAQRVQLPQVVDLAGLTERARRASALDGPELVLVARVARVATRLRREAQAWPDAMGQLKDDVRSLPPLDLLATLLGDALDDDGRLLDAASPELRRLRHEVVQLATRLRKRIAEMVKEADDDGILQDEYFTLRDDRYVLPVKSSDKRVLGGVIHGTSQTGLTVYVEPQEMVDGNNQLALAMEAVRREERRILAELSALVADESELLAAASRVLADLDLWQAAATLAAELRATRPEFALDGRILLRQARHPLLVLDGANVVANDVKLDNGARWLVISGPNGGGKTVVLTALGLAVQMARLGLPVCAAEGALLPWFDAVEVVLGDAQDIERGLSTFEGHLRAVQHALAQAQQAHARVLVLLDELAGGTEPLAGAALATAILETFGLAGTYGAATTHFEALKLLPLRDPAFQNAALQLDPGTLAPTYRLALGEFGSSNPLALAARVGLAPAIVERARELAGGAGGESAQLVDKLRAERALVHDQLAELENQRRQLDRQRAMLEDQRQREKAAADRRIERAAADALAQVVDVQRQLDEARRALREQDREALAAAQKALSHGQTELTQLRHGVAQPVGPQRKPWTPLQQRPDGFVWHQGLGRVVQILEVDAIRQKAKVQAGPLTVSAAFADLRVALPADLPRVAQKVPQSSLPAHVPEPVDDETMTLRIPERTVDLRGMRVEEGLEKLAVALDQAVLHGTPGLCIVHGMGTGAMREAARKSIRFTNNVKRFRAGRQGEGGDGATFVWFA